jgi:hypothetical protein
MGSSTKMGLSPSFSPRKPPMGTTMKSSCLEIPGMCLPFSRCEHFLNSQLTDEDIIGFLARAVLIPASGVCSERTRISPAECPLLAIGLPTQLWTMNGHFGHLHTVTFLLIIKIYIFANSFMYIASPNTDFRTSI